MRIDMEVIELITALERAINSTDLKDIELYVKGEEVEINPDFIEHFKFIGLSNIDFFTSGFYKGESEGFVELFITKKGSEEDES